MAIRIEEYERGHIWIHKNGTSKSGYCATTDDREQWGALLVLVEGEDECDKYLFTKSFESEKPVNREFLLTLIPELKERIASGNVKGLFVSELYKQAFRQMREWGYIQTCSRCGGSGHYSYNQIDGTRCFKCGGKKTVVMTPTKKLIARIKKERG
ncbi:hypothetical protein FACS1894217_05190 [Clostridia bacterium]|nr:hypothetical protein FACS1894217_05190 [Clostridia bacterium]